MPFAVNFSPLPLRSPETTTGGNKFPKSIKSFTRKRPMLSFAATNSTEEAQTTTPEIELEFIGLKAGGDGKYPVDRASAVSGEKLLRTIMADNKLELYGTYEMIEPGLLPKRQKLLPPSQRWRIIWFGFDRLMV